MITMARVVKRITVEVDPNTYKKFQEECTRIDLDNMISDLIKNIIENLQEYESS
jgi:hypothetical protein